jgi:predicted transcriptional regulator
MTKRTSVKLNPSTHRRLKLASVATSQPMNELADEAILDWLKRNQRRIAIPNISDVSEPTVANSGASS